MSPAPDGHAVDAPTPLPAPQILSLGERLRSERERKRLSLEELAQTTRIPIRMLRNLEEERYDELPGELFVRGFLRSYARALGLPPEHWAKKFRPPRAPAGRTLPAAIASVAAPERGRRFGVAIAVVVLLILFVLALSIVLRPRHQDRPVDLSLIPCNPSGSYALHGPSFSGPWTTAKRTRSSRS